MKKIFSYVGLCTCVAFLLSASPTYASDDLSRIESYLNNIKNLSAKFTQQSEGGTVEGKFYLARNPEKSGKMRVEYLTDPKIIIVVNGSILSYYDVELDEISRLSTNTTPASFLTRPNISFSAKDIEVTKLEKKPKEISVSLVKKNRKDAGEFTLTFSRKPFRFTEMKVRNDLGQIISVALSDIDFNKAIPNKMFVLSGKR